MFGYVILALLAVAMVVVMVLTWGSIGSVLMGFCLVSMGCALLHHRFLYEQEDSDFEMEV